MLLALYSWVLPWSTGGLDAHLGQEPTYVHTSIGNESFGTNFKKIMDLLRTDVLIWVQTKFHLYTPKFRAKVSSKFPCELLSTLKY